LVFVKVDVIKDRLEVCKLCPERSKDFNIVGGIEVKNIPQCKQCGCSLHLLVRQNIKKCKL